MERQIARVKAGSFQAWFDQVDSHYEVQWYDNHNPKAYRFPSIEEAKAFWHENVIDRKNFQYCYCCE